MFTNAIDDYEILKAQIEDLQPANKETSEGTTYNNADIALKMAHVTT